MTSADRDRHDHFLRLYVENEEALQGFVCCLVPTLENVREVMQETAALVQGSDLATGTTWKKAPQLVNCHQMQAHARWRSGQRQFRMRYHVSVQTPQALKWRNHRQSNT